MDEAYYGQKTSRAEGKDKDCAYQPVIWKNESPDGLVEIVTVENENGSRIKEHAEKKTDEMPMIVIVYTSSQPMAMMIHFFDTLLARRTVMGTFRFELHADVAGARIWSECSRLDIVL